MLHRGQYKKWGYLALRVAGLAGLMGFHVERGLDSFRLALWG